MVASNAFTHDDFRRSMTFLADGRVRTKPLHTRTVALHDLDSTLRSSPRPPPTTSRSWSVPSRHPPARACPVVPARRERWSGGGWQGGGRGCGGVAAEDDNAARRRRSDAAQQSVGLRTRPSVGARGRPVRMSLTYCACGGSPADQARRLDEAGAIGVLTQRCTAREDGPTRATTWSCLMRRPESNTPPC